MTFLLTNNGAVSTRHEIGSVLVQHFSRYGLLSDSDEGADSESASSSEDWEHSGNPNLARPLLLQPTKHQLILRQGKESLMIINLGVQGSFVAWCVNNLGNTPC